MLIPARDCAGVRWRHPQLVGWVSALHDCHLTDGTVLSSEACLGAAARKQLDTRMQLEFATDEGLTQHWHVRHALQHDVLVVQPCHIRVPH